MNAPLSSVILVEDDTDLRESTVEFLRHEGYEVTGVGSGLEFYREISARQYSVALIDLGLPDQAGEILVAYLRQNTRIAVIVITARDTVDTRVAVYQLGADLFMGKPINCGELAAAIGSLISRQHAAGHSAAKEEEPAPMSTGLQTWRLLVGERRLIAPDKVSVVLTGNEFDFMHCLAKRSGTMERSEILSCVYIQPGEGAERALEELVRRLRRKVSQATHQSPPILTHYGLGYAFAGQIEIVEC